MQSADKDRLSGRTDEPLQALVSPTAEMAARGGSGRLKGMAAEKEGRTAVSLALETMDGGTGFSGTRDTERQANEGEREKSLWHQMHESVGKRTVLLATRPPVASSAVSVFT